MRKIEEDDSKFSHAKVGRSISKGIQKARGAKVCFPKSIESMIIFIIWVGMDSKAVGECN